MAPISRQRDGLTIASPFSGREPAWITPPPAEAGDSTSTIARAPPMMLPSPKSLPNGTDAQPTDQIARPNRKESCCRNPTHELIGGFLRVSWHAYPHHGCRMRTRCRNSSTNQTAPTAQVFSVRQYPTCERCFSWLVLACGEGNASEPAHGNACTPNLHRWTNARAPCTCISPCSMSEAHATRCRGTWQTLGNTSF